MKALSQLIDKYLTEIEGATKKYEPMDLTSETLVEIVQLETEISVLTDVVSDLKKLREEIS